MALSAMSQLRRQLPTLRAAYPDEVPRPLEAASWFHHLVVTFANNSPTAPPPSKPATIISHRSKVDP